ncbi:hypothetical protein DUNSADRAFT_7624 [Dunaliella salina]|uniref:Encoded protein n=1 Tax=Dunaliella salina TaxID=3046 RepID=A0ABQ7GKX8_DUNSA|nr:hypothetical protein DUNSADRAFT_7624 [Dunaliella salina]|eukprot:KAF5835262.1 hypothetical protein DUNSADRAFT_7624 [Dunaliella salina]
MCRAEVSEAHIAGQTLPHPSLMEPLIPQHNEPAPDDTVNPLAATAMTIGTALPPADLLSLHFITSHEVLPLLMEVAQETNPPSQIPYPPHPHLMHVAFSTADSEPVSPLPPILPSREDLSARLSFLGSNSLHLAHAASLAAWEEVHDFLSAQLQVLANSPTSYPSTHVTPPRRATTIIPASAAAAAAAATATVATAAARESARALAAAAAATASAIATAKAATTASTHEAIAAPPWPPNQP